MKSLTRRQQEFLEKLLDLYSEESEPIHYSTIAEHLSVGRVTAYEMLRLLEDRGLAQAEYYRPEGVSGPGRSSVVFRPTPLAAKAIADLAGGEWDEKEWEQAKARVLEKLRTGRAIGYEALLEELLARLPERRSPVVYVTEMIAAVILGLYSLKEEVEAQGVASLLHEIGLPGEIGLSALGGLSAGLSLVECINRRMANVFLAQARKFQKLLLELNAENRRRLAEFAREVLEIVGI